MSKLLDLYLCSIVTIGELIAIFIGLILVQAIFYRVFKINLYEIIKNKLRNIGRRIERCFAGL